MAIYTVTTNPQRIFKAGSGDKGVADQVSLRLSPSATGNVFIGQNATECAASTAYYFNEADRVSIDLYCGQELWACTSSSTVSIRVFVEGPEV